MGLVDGEPPCAELLQAHGQPVGQEALRRDEQEAQRAGAQEPPGLERLLVRGHGVERRRRHADRGHLAHLVAHQGDQRRHHDGERAVDQGRELVAHGLAAAGRHDREHVLSGQDGGDDLGLAGPEIVVAEHRFERRARRGEPGRHDLRPRRPTGSPGARGRWTSVTSTKEMIRSRNQAPILCKVTGRQPDSDCVG